MVCLALMERKYNQPCVDGDAGAYSSISQSVVFLFLVDRQATRSHVDEENESSDDGKSLEEVVLEEVALRVGGVDGPPVVGKDIENAQDEDKEASRPLRLEADRNHNASAHADNGDQNTHDRPFTLDDESEEQEDEENTSGEEEIFLPVGFSDLREASEHAFP